MPAIATEGRVVSLLCCMLVLFDMFLVCHLNLCVPKKALKMKFQSLARLLLSGVASSANVIKSVVSSTTTRHEELKINFYLSYNLVAIIGPCLISHQSLKQTSVKAPRSVLSSSLVSPNLGTRFLLSGVVCHTPIFLILGCE